MGDWPITVIPNPIDLNVWAPCDQAQARALLGLPAERPLVLFGAMGGSADPRKGADLLLEALQRLRSQVAGTPLEQLELVVFGQSRPAQPPDLGFPIHYSGHLHDDLSLRLLYAAADVFVIPSRQDNLPNTGLEAHACGTPVVAFATGGLVDIVDHHVTGALASRLIRSRWQPRSAGCWRIRSGGGSWGLRRGSGLSGSGIRRGWRGCMGRCMGRRWSALPELALRHPRYAEA
jgi:glycosyltransferase involved in cell wall biosynthesis